MKKYTDIIFVAFAALGLCSCQKGLELGSRIDTISFNPSINGMAESGKTRAASITTDAGSYEIPVWLTVSDGIGEALPAMTRGELLNTSGADQDFSTYNALTGGKFHVTGWEGDRRFIPSSGSGYDEISYDGGSGAWISSDVYKWGGKTALSFYSYANLPAEEEGVVEASVSSTAAGSQDLHYDAVPADARKQKDILMGYGQLENTEAAAGNTCTADISFYHPLTAVRFVKGDTFDGIDDIKFKAIYLSQVYKSGKAEMTPSSAAGTDPGEKFAWTDLSTTMQEAALESGADLATSDPLEIDSTTGVIGEAFIIIPQDLTAKPVTVTIVAEFDGNLNSMRLTLDTGKWEAGKTYTYILGRTIDSSGYTFTFEDMDGNSLAYLMFRNTVETGCESFKLVESSKDGGTVPVGYSAFYSTDNGATWTEYDATVTGISGLAPTGNEGLASGEAPRTVGLYSNPRVKPSDMYFWKDRAGEPEMKGSVAAPVDLSKLPIGGEGAEGAEQHTANCYIVKHAGYYKFPCVYGNGNFHTDASGDHILGTFVNAKGDPISSKYILADVTATAPKAALLWSDFRYKELTLANDVELIGSGSSAYIRFRTPSRDDLAEGNAVIVLYDDMDSDGCYDEGEALWSWHIWVSDSDLGADNVGTVDTRFGKFSFMSRNIGWCGRVNSLGSVQVDPPFDNFLVRLVQNESGKTQDIRILQYAETDYGMVGSSSLYQYGRKDPFAGEIQNGNIDTSTNAKAKKTYHPDGTVLTSRPYAVLSTGRGSLAYGMTNVASMIRNPETVNSFNLGMDGWFSNLWSMSNIHFSQMAYGAPLVKTIYDPSPYGYLVANPNAFNTFTNVIVDKGGDHGSIIGYWSAGKDPIEGAVINDDAERMFFPANGFLSFTITPEYTQLSFRNFRTGFYSWTSAPGDTQGEIVNIKDYTFSTNDINFAVGSWCRAISDGTEMYPLGTFASHNMLPVRPVLEVGNGGRPVEGTILYRENFNIGTNSDIYIDMYDMNPRGAYTFGYFTFPEYAATTSPTVYTDGPLKSRLCICKDSSSSLTPTPNVDGAYLRFWPYDASNETYTFTVSNIKTWGAHKVRLTFSSYKSVGATSSCTSTCTINGQTKSFESSPENSFEFTLSGSEETISIVFTNKGSGYPMTCIDDIILSYVN